MQFSSKGKRVEQAAVLESNTLFSAEALLAERLVDEALAEFDLAESEGYNPDACSAGRWTCHMLKGDFELAWRESDRISNRGNPDPNRFWDGTELTGKSVLLRCLHGLGDTLQFIRYASLIRERAQRLTVEAQPALASFLRECNLADEVITWGDREPHWDQQVEVVELPRIFRTTVESIPAQIPYLKLADPPLRREEKDGAFRVGLVWASSVFNTARSLPLSQLAPVLSMAEVQCFSLQAGNERAQLNECRMEVPDVCGESPDITVTARAISDLDLVVTVDTMVAHLAGGLGCQVWTLLPYAGDWRWMLNRSDSPWYPTMRLFRQPRPGDWTTVVSQVVQELTSMLEARKLSLQGGDCAT